MISLLSFPSVWLIWQTVHSRGAVFSSWWDIVDERLLDSYCRADVEFQGTAGLITNCRNVELSRWLREHIKKESIARLSVLPAQTLYYRTFFKVKPLPGLVIAWNDFGNFENTTRVLENCFLKIGNCPGSLDALILFPTSKDTLEASWRNFGRRAGPFERFHQNKIEKMIINYQGDDFSRYFYQQGETSVLLFVRKTSKKD